MNRLIDILKEKFYFLDKTHISDGEGGFETSWVKGAEFEAVIDLPNTSTAKIADAVSDRQNCNITTSKTIMLEFGDVIVRKSDNQAFRILSNGQDVKTPPTSSLDMRQVKAEYWEVESSD